MRDGAIRASDDDRERVARSLRDHAVAGRLSVEELDERSGRAFAARTLGELEALFDDLPRARRELARAESRSPAVMIGLMLGQGVLWTVVGIAVVTIAVLCILVRVSLRLARMAAAAADARALRAGSPPVVRRGLHGRG